MRMYDIIKKKRDGLELSRDEISFMTRGYTSDNIPDYQMSAFTMAVMFRGMTPRETAILTDEMAGSGDMLDLSELGSGTMDKHSTGGVGDKTTLIVAPVVASLGGVIAKMSGRGLGHTGGTCDKLESFPGYRLDLSPEEFIGQAKRIGVAVVGQSAKFAPFDKKLYALRDVTATVDSIPLIASSIMSKKLAAGAKNIVLDVKFGSGAFMKSVDDARELARQMADIGTYCGRNVEAVLTNMDQPLGYAVGNILEVKEAIAVLSGRLRGDIYEVALALASRLISMARGIATGEALSLAKGVIDDGSALSKLREWIGEQGGDVSYVDDPEKFPRAKTECGAIAEKDGFIRHIDAEKVGLAAMLLGAGREKKDDDVDRTAGILLKKKVGDSVSKGEVLMTLYTNRKDGDKAALELLADAVSIGEEAPEITPTIYETITKGQK